MDAQNLDSDSLAGWENLGAKGRAKIEARAAQDAHTFVSEFPGQSLQGDWDSQAWEIANKELSRDGVEIGRAAESAGHDVAWQLYAEALRAEVERLRG